MAYRNLENLGRSRNQITNDLNFEHNNTVHRIMDKDLFQRTFELEKLCNSFNKDKTNKIPLGLYYPIRICVNNFNKLEYIENKCHNKNITGNDILEYYRGIISDIDSLEKSSKGENLIASMLKNHSSVKYAYIMDKYYNEFLEKVALLTSICTDTSITENVTTFAKMNAQLDEIIWLYFLERVVKRTKADEKTVQFDINEALRGVIRRMSKIHEKCENQKIDEKLGNLSGKTDEEYNKQKAKLEKKYFSKAQRLLNIKKQNEKSDKFYSDLNQYYTLFDENYNLSYQTIFIQYATSSYEYKLCALKNILQLTDIYGRMLLPHLVDNIDKETNCIYQYMMILFEKRYDDLDQFYSKHHKTIKDLFLIVEFKDNKYCLDDRVSSLGVECTKFISNIFKETEEDVLEPICEFSKYFLSKKAVAPIKLIQDNIIKIQHYLNYCSGYTNFLRYNNYVNKVNKTYVKHSKQLKKDNVYQKVRDDIDSAIAHKWIETMFPELKNT